MNNRLMIFKEPDGKEFDFNSMIGDNSYATLSGIPVKIDRIIRNVTRTTVIAISGTFVLRGVKVRGVWDMFGNIIEAKKMLELLSLKSFTACLEDLFGCYPNELFNLVNIQEANKKDDPSSKEKEVVPCNPSEQADGFYQPDITQDGTLKWK